MARQEHLQRGYCAVLRLRGYVPCVNADPEAEYRAVIIDVGKELAAYANGLANLRFEKIIFIVPAGWQEELPAFAGMSVLCAPVSAGALLTALAGDRLA